MDETQVQTPPDWIARLESRRHQTNGAATAGSSTGVSSGSGSIACCGHGCGCGCIWFLTREPLQILSYINWSHSPVCRSLNSICGRPSAGHIGRDCSGSHVTRPKRNRHGRTLDVRHLRLGIGREQG